MRTMRVIMAGLLIFTFGTAAAQDTLSIRTIQEVLPGEDSSHYAGDTVYTGGIVVHKWGSSNDGFVLADPGGGRFGYIRASYTSNWPSIEVGDSLLFRARVQELSGFESITNLRPISTEVYHGNPIPIPGPEILVGSQITSYEGDNPEAEPFENALIRIYSVQLDSTFINFENVRWVFHDSTAYFQIDPDNSSVPSSFRPISGTPFEYVQGILEYGLNGYYLRPRSIFDLRLPQGSPYIYNIRHSPQYPTAEDPVTISATIIDDGNVASVSLFYQVDEAWVGLEMAEGDSDSYSAIILPFPLITFVHFYFAATDNEGNITLDPFDAPIHSHNYSVNAIYCDYIWGDVNASGAVNPQDIVYLVRFFVREPGLPYPPPIVCDCRPMVPQYPFFAAASNGNCEAGGGLLITYLVNYFKGGPYELPVEGGCPYCRPRPR